jgi:hypothetical protein
MKVDQFSNKPYEELISDGWENSGFALQAKGKWQHHVLRTYAMEKLGEAIDIVPQEDIAGYRIYKKSDGKILGWNHATNNIQDVIEDLWGSKPTGHNE